MGSNSSSNDWKSEEQIRREEFRAGYDREAASGQLRDDERNDGGDSEMKYTHTEGAASETTLYADKTEDKDKYDPNQSLPNCEHPYPTKGSKFSRLWALNAGWDGHRVDGKNYTDEEIHKVDQPARERARFTHAVACAVELPQTAIHRCTGVAKRLDPRKFNYYGGMDTFILSIVKHVAQEYDWEVDAETFQKIRDDWNVGSDDLTAAREKVGEELNPGE